jgi:hypothetical protein
VGWAPCSLDLTPCDYWLWEYLKSKVFLCQPRTLNQLKDLIREAVHEITVEMLENAVYNLISRLDKIEENNGQHIK